METKEEKSGKMMWYRAFRKASYGSIVGALVFTVLIALPFAPFSSMPPIIISGGPGYWLALAYLLLLAAGVGGFGTLSGLVKTVEDDEKRVISKALMWPGFVLLSIGFASSCVLLALAGAAGGYASVVDGESVTAITNLLSPYTLPITVSTLTAVIGAALVLWAMASARRCEP